MHHDGDVPGEQVLGVRPRLGGLPALRVGQEDLDGVGVHLRGPGERAAVQELVLLGQARSDVDPDQLFCHPGDPTDRRW
jgi:hypothetical protein